MTKTPDMIRYRIRVEGRVQEYGSGVHQGRAGALGVQGWVRNLLTVR